jgi:hypothetical protein
MPMLSFNKAAAGGIAAGGLTRFTDWFVAGVSNELAHTAWGVRSRRTAKPGCRAASPSWSVAPSSI